jgi:hypothetical protein
MLCLLLTAVTWNPAAAAESKFTWWPFGRSDEAPPAPAAAVAPPLPAPTTPTPTTPIEAPTFRWPSLPKWGFPEMTIPDDASTSQERPKRARFGKPAYGQSRPTRNSWAQPPGSPVPQLPKSSPWQTVTDGARRVGESTRNAWKKTVDWATPGDEPTPRVAQAEPQESWWSRMWGTNDAASEGPQTVTEWMAQERLDP